MIVLTNEQIADRTIQHGNKYPYDAPDAWWNDGDVNSPPPPSDWAHSAARGVLADLSDRRGIKRGFEDLDESIRADIVKAISNIIRVARNSA